MAEEQKDEKAGWPKMVMAEGRPITLISNICCISIKHFTRRQLKKYGSVLHAHIALAAELFSLSGWIEAINEADSQENVSWLAGRIFGELEKSKLAAMWGRFELLSLAAQLLTKLRLHPEWAQLLAKTGLSTLAACGEDPIWETGFETEDEGALNRGSWQCNAAGRLYTATRSLIRGQEVDIRQILSEIHGQASEQEEEVNYWTTVAVQWAAKAVELAVGEIFLEDILKCTFAALNYEQLKGLAEQEGSEAKCAELILSQNHTEGVRVATEQLYTAHLCDETTQEKSHQDADQLETEELIMEATKRLSLKEHDENQPSTSAAAYAVINNEDESVEWQLESESGQGSEEEYEIVRVRSEHSRRFYCAWPQPKNVDNQPTEEALRPTEPAIISAEQRSIFFSELYDAITPWSQPPRGNSEATDIDRRIPPTNKGFHLMWTTKMNWMRGPLGRPCYRPDCDHKNCPKGITEPIKSTTKKTSEKAELGTSDASWELICPFDDEETQRTMRNEYRDIPNKGGYPPVLRIRGKNFITEESEGKALYELPGATDDYIPVRAYAQPTEQGRQDEPEERDLPAYLVAQVQLIEVIGILMNQHRFRGHPKYILLGENTLEEQRNPDKRRFQQGQIWTCESTTPSNKQGGKYRQLREEEEQGGHHRDNRANNKLPKKEGGYPPVIHQETINYQAVAVNPVKLVEPEMRRVIGRISERTSGQTMTVTATELKTPIRVELRNTVGGYPQGDAWIGLMLAKLPKWSFVGKRYTFPPLSWHPKDCNTDYECWTVAYAIRINRLDNGTLAGLIEAKMATNVNLFIQAEKERALEASLRSTLDIQQDNTATVVMERPDSVDNKVLMQKLKGRWKKDELVEVRTDAGSGALAQGFVVEAEAQLNGQEWSFRAKIELEFLGLRRQALLRNQDGELAEMLLVVPSSSMPLEVARDTLCMREASKAAMEQTPRGAILRAIFGMNGYKKRICANNHLEKGGLALNTSQRAVANSFCCDCKENANRETLIVAVAPEGSGKSRTITEMVQEALRINPNRRILMVCTSNRPLLNLACTVARNIRKDAPNVMMKLALSREAQRGNEEMIRRHRLRAHVVTMGWDPLTGRVFYRPAADVVQTLEKVKPQILMMTTDKASLLASALSEISHCTGDEFGRETMVNLTHLVSSMPKLKTLHITGDPEQFGVYDRDFPRALQEDDTGFESALISLASATPTIESYLLDVSYRQHPALLEPLARTLYGNLLRTATTAADRGLLTQVAAKAGFHLPRAGYPAILINNTAPYTSQPTSTSIFNQREIDCVLEVYTALQRRLKATGATFLFACAYAATNEELRNTARRRGVALDPSCVKNVDEIIGDEADIVFLPLTKSGVGDWSFLCNLRRTVVSWTRMKHGLIVIGDFNEYVKHEVKIKKLVEAFTEHTPIVEMERYLSAMNGAGNRRNEVLLDGRRTVVDSRLRELNQKWIEANTAGSSTGGRR